MKTSFGPAIVILAATLSLPASAQNAEDCYQATLKTDDREVIRICTQALEKGGLEDRSRSITISNRGLGYLRTKEYDKSIIDFSEALLINPKNAFAFNFRGEAWREKGNFERALADFEEALAIDAAFTASIYNRGVTFERQGNPNAARAEYEKALAQKGTLAIDNWARDRARERLTALGGNPQQQQKQRPDDSQQRGRDRDTRNTQDDQQNKQPQQKQQPQTNPGSGSEGSYQRRK